MWTPGIVRQIFCTLLAPVAFPHDPQETDEMRDEQPPRGMEGTAAGAMEQQQVVVLGVLHVCFFFTSRGQSALCCASSASCASCMSCLRIAFGAET